MLARHPDPGHPLSAPPKGAVFGREQALFKSSVGLADTAHDDGQRRSGAEPVRPLQTLGAAVAMSDSGRHHAPVQGKREGPRRKQRAGEYGLDREEAGSSEQRNGQGR